MPRNVDFRAAMLSVPNLRKAFDRLNAELSQATTMATSALLELPVWTGARQGADLNTVIDRIDAKITKAAVLVGKAGVGLTSRSQDFTTGTHDVTRLHAELDRLHARIAALASNSPSSTPAYPIVVHRMGAASYVGTAGTITTDTSGAARHGFPYLIAPRNLYSASEYLTQAVWAPTGMTVAVAGSYGDTQGSSNLFLLTRTAIDEWRCLSQTYTVTSGQAYTVSAIYKAASCPQGYLSAFVGSTPGINWNCRFNLSGAGTFQLNSTGGGASGCSTISASISSLGSGFYLCSVTFTPSATVSSVQARVSMLGTQTIGDTVYVTRPQFETGSSRSIYQATAATTIPNLDPTAINGAGLVLEPATTNYLTNPDNEAAAVTYNGWSGAQRVSPTRDTVTKLAGTYALKLTTSGIGITGNTDNYYVAGQDGATNSFAGPIPTNATYTASAWVYVPSSGGAPLSSVYLQPYWYNTGTSQYGSVVGTKPTAYDQWQRITATFTLPAAIGSFFLRLYVAVATDGLVAYFDNLQVEPGHVATSFISGSRGADVAGIVGPHNLIPCSVDMSSATFWSNYNVNNPFPTANTTDLQAPDGTYTAYKMVPTVTFTGRSTTLVPITAGQTYTASGWFYSTITNGVQIWIRFYKADGTTQTGATASVNWSPGAKWERNKITATAPSDAAFAIVSYTSNNGTGTLYVWQPQLTEGNHPGVVVRTTNQAVVNPGNGLDAAWQQNGYLEWYSVHPGDFGVLGVSGGFNFIGSGSPSGSSPGNLRVYRFPWATSTNYVKASRHTNVGPWNPDIPLGGFLGTLYLYDGARHRMRFEWTNYINSSSVREMWLRLYIDGVRVFNTERSAIDGSSSWLAIDPTTLLSDGYTNAAISLLTFGTPILPQGAIPAA